MDAGGEFFDFNRFGYEIVHTSGKAGLAVTLESVGGKGDDAWLVLLRERGTDLSGGIKAIHLRHLDVHKNKVIRTSFECAQAFEPVGDGVGAVAEVFEEAQGDFLVNQVVLRHEDGERDGLSKLLNIGDDAGGSEGGVEAEVAAESSDNVGGASGTR